MPCMRRENVRHATFLFSAAGGRATKSREKQKQKETRMYCTKCGNQIDDTAAFCTKCGTPTNGNRATPNGRATSNVEVKSHMVGAILQTVVCIPAGIVPLIYACKVNSKLAQGDIAGAQEASKKAKFWLNLTTAIVGAIIILYILAFAIGPAASKAAQKAQQQRQAQSENYY